MPPLRIGYVPATNHPSIVTPRSLTVPTEHFSTPLHFALTHFSLPCTLIPFPSGTGDMITSLRAHEIDVGIGLTEGWVAGLASPPPRQTPATPAQSSSSSSSSEGGYKIVGTYVETPLCWAVSTGATRADITHLGGLKGKRIGVSRVGSGSYVMGFVLADARAWLDATAGDAAAPFSVVPLQTFARLREAVNGGAADFFMWEHFTSKRYYDNGEIKKIGEMYTPWSSWKIVAREEVLEERKQELEEMFEKLDSGVSYFEGHQEEAVGYISTELDYSAEDAREWLKTVRFAKGVKGVRVETIRMTVDALKKAGVVEGEVSVEDMIGIRRDG